MDIRIDSEEGKFKFRVCGIVKANDKYLAVRMDENDFFCLPGGHVELGEDTDEAVLREMEEELGYKVKIERAVCVIQNFFKSKQGKCFHELGYYYVVSPVDMNNVNTNDYDRRELDKGVWKTLEFKWFTLEQLKQVDFRPKALVDNLENSEFKNIFVKD